jgi:hypothetical protein
MNKRRGRWAIGLAGACLTLLGYAYVGMLQRGELGQKDKYAFLQGVELEYRGRADGAGRPVLLMRSQTRPYAALGMPSDAPGVPFVWILLDDDEGGDMPVKLMPGDAEFRLSCSELPYIMKKVSIVPEVAGYLRAHCQALRG